MDINKYSILDEIEKLKKEVPRPIFKSERAELLNQLYTFYEKDYKKQTWKEYIIWLRNNNKKHSNDSINDYKKIAYKKITIKSFCSFWLSHIPTKDLYYLISIARDCDNRNVSFNKWLFWSLRKK